MRKPEQRFWDRARPRLLRTHWAERIENLVTVGMPDVVTLQHSSGRVRFVELKAVPRWPVRAATRVLGAKGLSQDQMNWHLQWRKAGGNTGILVGVGSYEQVYLDGAHADDVNEMSRAELTKVGATDWNEILELI